MRCEHVQQLVSAGMDDLVARSLPDEVRDHARSCPACRAFATGAWRIRRASRLELAPAPPPPVKSPRAARHCGAG